MADSRKISPHFTADGESFYDTFSDINPAIGSSTIMGDFMAKVQGFTDGDLVKVVQDDKTTFYPSAGGE